MKRLLFFALALSLHCAAHAAEGFSTLEERMTGKEFKETGLDKLSAEELSALNHWLRRHSVATLENAAAGPAPAAAGAAEDLRGFDKRRNEDPGTRVIKGIIAGSFDGWKGKGTLFKLTNGMVWKQAEEDVFHVRAVENAAVTIKKGVFGDWRLSMDGFGSAVRVERIQ